MNQRLGCNQFHSQARPSLNQRQRLLWRARRRELAGFGLLGNVVAQQVIERDSVQQVGQLVGEFVLPIQVAVSDEEAVVGTVPSHDGHRLETVGQLDRNTLPGGEPIHQPQLELAHVAVRIRLGRKQKVVVTVFINVDETKSWLTTRVAMT